MNKFLILLFCTLLFFGASALGFILKNFEGQVFSETQFSDQNWLNQNYGFKINNTKLVGNQSTIQIELLFFRPNQIGTTWNIMQDISILQLELKPYFNCRKKGYSKNECTAFFKTEYIKPAVVSFKSEMGNKYNELAKDIKEKYSDELNSIDWSISEEELNNE